MKRLFALLVIVTVVLNIGMSTDYPVNDLEVRHIREYNLNNEEPNTEYYIFKNNQSVPRSVKLSELEDNSVPYTDAIRISYTHNTDVLYNGPLRKDITLQTVIMPGETVTIKETITLQRSIDENSTPLKIDTQWVEAENIEKNFKDENYLKSLLGYVSLTLLGMTFMLGKSRKKNK